MADDLNRFFFFL